MHKNRQFASHLGTVVVDVPVSVSGSTTAPCSSSDSENSASSLVAFACLKRLCFKIVLWLKELAITCKNAGGPLLLVKPHALFDDSGPRAVLQANCICEAVPCG